VEIGEKLATLRERLASSDGVQLVLGASAPLGPKPGGLSLLGIGLIWGFLIGYLRPLSIDNAKFKETKN